MRTCSVDGCGQPHRARGYCFRHYWRARNAGEFTARPTATRKSGGLLGGYAGEPTPRGGSAVLHWPARPRAVTDALHALAETPGLTPDQYERRKAEILRGATP